MPGNSQFQDGQHLRQQVGRDRRDDAEAEPPLHHQPAAPGRRLDIANVGKNAFDPRLQGHGLVGHPDRLSAALEQAAGEPFLHLGDLRRQRRLADAGDFRSPPEMQGLRQCVEILHLSNGDPDHRARLSQRTAKAICLYDAGEPSLEPFQCGEALATGQVAVADPDHGEWLPDIGGKPWETQAPLQLT